MPPCYTSYSNMTKRFSTKIGPRDFEILTAIEQTPLTPTQLCRLSQTFSMPFTDEHNLRRRLRSLSSAGLLRSWPYAMVTDGRSPKYAKLTREGYRLLHGEDAPLPRRRFFEEVSHGHHHHTHALAESIVHLAISSHGHGIAMQQFARENSVRLTAGGFTVYPDAAFQLVTRTHQKFNFVLELDNGTERVKTNADVESIKRKLRGYDAHNSQFSENDPRRYVVIFLTTRSHARVENILTMADSVTSNRERTVFVGSSLNDFLQTDPFTHPVLNDHRFLKRTILPTSSTSFKKRPTFMTPAAVL